MKIKKIFILKLSLDYDVILRKLKKDIKDHNEEVKVSPYELGVKNYSRRWFIGAFYLERSIDNETKVSFSLDWNAITWALVFLYCVFIILLLSGTIQIAHEVSEYIKLFLTPIVLVSLNCLMWISHNKKTVSKFLNNKN